MGLPDGPDIREKKPGQCPRCKMDLVAGIPPFEEYPLRLQITPRAWRPGQKIRMRFEVLHPKTGQRVRDFVLVHERYFHLFLVSGDLQFFAHEHPEPQPDGTFLFDFALPKPGLYRVLGDFYPRGGTPQLAVQSIVSAGGAAFIVTDPPLGPVKSEARGENLSATLRTEPAEPVAGWKTLLFLELSDARGLGAIPGRVGTPALRQRRSDRPDSHPSVSRRWRPEDAVQRGFSTRRHAPAMASVSTGGCCEYPAV